MITRKTTYPQFIDESAKIVFPLSKSLQKFVPNHTPFCWKRDGYGLTGGEYSRTVYFLPHFTFSQDSIELRHVDFFYSQTGPKKIIGDLILDLSSAKNCSEISRNGFNFELISKGSVSNLQIKSKIISKDSECIIKKLLATQPKANVEVGRWPAPTEDYCKIKKSGDVIIYSGSGTSYGAGLPTLGKIHEIFFVDNIAKDRFVFGVEDEIPNTLFYDGHEFYRRAFDFYVKAAVATPSFSHLFVAEKISDPSSRIKGLITENIDFLFEKAGAADVVRARTIFNVTAPGEYGFALSHVLQNQPSIDPQSTTLLVVGIAADRRGVVRKARELGMSIVCVNPHEQVSPRAQNLSYLELHDVWFKKRSDAFFKNIPAHLF